ADAEQTSAAMVVRKEQIGPFTKEILNVEVDAVQSTAEWYFGEETREADVYVRLIIGDKFFALAKENIKEQTLMTFAPPPLDLNNPRSRDEYYSLLLSYAASVTVRENKGIELIERNGRQLKEYLSQGMHTADLTLPTLIDGSYTGANLQANCIRNLYGHDKLFQMEYQSVSAQPGARPTLFTEKKSSRPLARGCSFIVQPKRTVLINGYGVIGSKAADAARRSGFAVAVAVRSEPRISDALSKGYPIYFSGTNAAEMDKFKNAGINFSGTLEEALASGTIDAVIDGTPGGVGAANLENIYNKYPDLVVLLEGGEGADIVEGSFSSTTNYDSVKGKSHVRIVSCNTTGMARIYGQLLEESKLYIDNLALRRGADPGETKGPNPDSAAIIPAYHHGPDFRTILSEKANANILGINTDAGLIPSTHYHLHNGTIRGEGITVEKVKEILKAQSRVGLIEFPKGQFQTPTLFEIFNNMIPDANHPYIIPAQVLPSSIEGQVKITFAVPQESNVVPENVNALQAVFGLFQKDAGIRLVDEVLGIDRIKAGLEMRLPTKLAQATESDASKRAVRGAAGAGSFAGELKTNVPIINRLPDQVYAGKKALIRVDFNVGSKDKVTANERLVAAIPTLAYLMDKGLTLVLTSHNGRPDGEVVSELSLDYVADELARLLKEAGYNIPVNFIAGSITENGLAAGVKDKIVEGAINILENTRFYKGETDNDPAFAKALADLADNYLYIFDGFGVAERLHASTGGAAQYMQKVALGLLMEKEIRYLEGAKDNLFGLIIGGGPKLNEKVPVIKNVAENIKEGGFILIQSGPAPAFLKLLYNVEVGQKPTEQDIADAELIRSIATDKNIEVVLPSDFIALDRDLFQKADGDKTWFDLGKIPDDANIYLVTLEQLKQGTFIDENTNRELSSQDLFLYDVGPATSDMSDKMIMSAKRGDSIFWNGSAGTDELTQFQEGSNRLSGILSQATEKNEVITVVGGGDTVKTAKKFKANVTHASTGGGASMAVLQGKKLQVMGALETLQSEVDIAKSFNSDRLKLAEFNTADNVIYKALGGEFLGAFMNALSGIDSGKTPARALVASTNFIKTLAARSALLEVISRLQDTVRVALYGEDAEKIKALLGKENIITAATLGEVITKLSEAGISTKDTLVLSSPEDSLDSTLEVKQVVAGRLSTLTIAKALKELFSKEGTKETHIATTDFEIFFEKLAEAEIITESTYLQTNLDVLAELEAGGVFEFPAELEPAQNIAQSIEGETKVYQEFITGV
ncbi:MAG: type II glyceraldehyde-3-phosphate dehydrogenase, partial [Candidatus Omnitrophota bacterium]